MKKLFYLFCLILLSNIAFSQLSDWNKPLDSNFAQMYLHPADYIFEGTLEEYSVQNIKNVPFYVSKIKVTKVFKGQLVITNKIVVYQKTNEDSNFSSDLYIEQENIKLKKEVLTRKNLSALYICNKKIDNSNKGKTENIYVRNGFRYLLDYDGKIGDPSTGYGYQYDKYTIRMDSASVILPYPYKSPNTLKELYDFLSLNGYPILQSNGEVITRKPDPVQIIPPEIKMNWDSVYKANREYVLSDESPFYFEEKLKKINKENKRKNRKNQRQNNYNLNYNIINETYTCSNTIDTYLEFDIEIVSNQACYFAQGWVFLNYNTAVFGNNINQSGGLFINNGSNFPNQYSNYKSDWSASQIALAINTTLTASKTFIGSNSSNVLLHVKMKILNTINTTQLSFDEVAMNNTFESRYSIANNSGTWLKFNCFATDVEDHIPVKPIIDNITYSKPKLSGGTGTIVTITGRFFGSSGKVSFPDADNKGTYATLNNSDFVTNGYKDRKIIFSLPSVVDFTDIADATNNDPTPGSGKINIINDCGGEGFSEPVIIDYALLTDDQNTKPRIYEVGFNTPNTTEKKIRFNIDKEIFDNPGAMQGIRSAMRQWSCETGINLEIGNITTSTSNPKYNNNDGVNTIFYINDIKYTANATTYRNPCLSLNFSKERDISINFNRAWNYKFDVANASNEYDFVRTILHEFGHVCNLDHTLNSGNVMLPVGPPGETPRRILLTQNEISGGNDVMAASLAYNPAGACNAFTMNAANKTAIGCYATSSQKMQLEGISISCKCAPGFATNGANPILQPRIYGGVEPYYYYWEALSGNSTTLSNAYVKEPSITAATGTRKVKYKFTVIDNAAEPTIASRIIDVDLKTAQTVDYAMRDSYEDVYDEPNNQAHWDIWNSPDIWNRKTSGTTNTEHENPEYFAAAPNYVNFRIRNIGCITPPVNKHAVRLYWTKSSTGEKWDLDWKTANTPNGKALGREITTGNGFALSNTNQLIAPGQEKTFFFAWNPPLPQDYPEFGNPTPTQIDVCILARIESGTGSALPPFASPYGMTTPELFDFPTPQKALKQNLLKNNDIITRNLIVTNLNPNDINGPGGTVHHYAYIDNIESTANSYTIEFSDIFQSNSFDFRAYGNITLNLGNELYSRWAATGKKGTGFTLIPNSTKIMLNDRYGFRLEQLQLNADEQQLLEFQFKLRSGAQDIISKTFKHTFSQFLDGQTIKTGSINFLTNIKPAVITQPQENPQQGGEEVKIKPIDNFPATQPDLFQQTITVYPNPTNQNITLFTWFEKSVNVKTELRDITGRLILSEPRENVNGSYQKTFDVANLASGVYLINLIMNDRIVVKKFVKQ